MSKIREAIELVVEIRKTHRMQPLGYGKMLEDGFNNLVDLLKNARIEAENECCVLRGEVNRLTAELKAKDDLLEEGLNLFNSDKEGYYGWTLFSKWFKKIEYALKN